MKRKKISPDRIGDLPSKTPASKTSPLSTRTSALRTPYGFPKKKLVKLVLPKTPLRAVSRKTANWRARQSR